MSDFKLKNNLHQKITIFWWYMWQLYSAEAIFLMVMENVAAILTFYIISLYRSGKNASTINLKILGLNVYGECRAELRPRGLWQHKVE